MTRRFAVLTSILATCLGPTLLAQDTQAPAPLRIIRTTPSGDAGPTATISVTLDRPVAGSLDRTVDPATVLSVSPPVTGRLEWRDPVTVRLIPVAPLAAGMVYTVTVASTFRAMDGGQLAAPHQFSFRVRGPTLLTGAPVRRGGTATHLMPDQRFELVYSASVDLASFSNSAFLEFSAACGGERIIPLGASRQRRISKDDSWDYREAGGYQRDQTADSLRRVVELVPASRLPFGCSGILVAPQEIGGQSVALERWPISTYGEFRVAQVTCPYESCPTGPLRITFTNPVRGSEVARRLKVLPEVAFTLGDTAAESTSWTLTGTLKPHVSYAVVADTAMRDIFGQSLRGNPASGYRTTGYASSIMYPFGRVLVERAGFRTLAVQHVNVDTLVATIAAIPDSLIPKVLGGYAWADDANVWGIISRGASVQRIGTRAGPDIPSITAVRLPAPNATMPAAATLFAVRIHGRRRGMDVVTEGPFTVAQVTNLGLHARVGMNDGAIWVTGVNDGLPKRGVTVALHDSKGKVLATMRTDPHGFVYVRGWSNPEPVQTSEDDANTWRPFEGYVTATLGEDRAITAINAWDPDLSAYQFGVNGAWGDARLPIAGAVFTERGIYRPGERVYAKAIVRYGALGALRVPARGDSVKWTFNDREQAVLREVTMPLSAFGTSDQSMELPSGAPIGQYGLQIRAKRNGAWRSVAQTSYRVAEYRPPEFLVDVTGPSTARFPRDTFSAAVQARYLFGAPMGRAAFEWVAQRQTVYSWDLDIPGMDDWYIGDSESWWEEAEESESAIESGTDTLDARGMKSISVVLPADRKGRAARVTLQALVTDVNRQVVAASASTLVHPAEFYIAAKPTGSEYFWRAGQHQQISLLAVRPNGERVSNVAIEGRLVRREWHRVRRERDGITQTVGEWVTDTVGSCRSTSGATPAPCTFTPKLGGMYVVSFSATDAHRREAKTSFARWVSGPDWVPWSDETQFKMDVIADRTRYSVGDTATVMFASPFTNADAWITIEREGLLEQRRLRVTSGSMTLKYPITEAFAPNVYVSIVVARGRSAPPGPLDDPGRPTIRVGYAQLRVTPEVKRLAIALRTDKPEYRPGDSARVHVQVRDGQGRGPRSEVTLWAVDEGVLSLTGYKTPDPIDLIYRARGLGMRLASNMTSVAPQVPEGEKGKREAGGGGGASAADVLRSRFQTTAFFIGSVITDAQGNGVAAVKLPDNLTTFRVMAVAVTAGDRYGQGESSLLVTRPVLARAALPRFIRPGDEFSAGAVINRRDGAATEANVKAAATGVTLRGVAERSARLAEGRGVEVRFPFTALRQDSATFRFDVASTGDVDALRVSIPVRPEYHPRAYTVAGVLHDTASAELLLPADIDPARSRLSLSIGASPLATIGGIARSLRVYPYYCSEQLISTAVPLIAVYRAQQQTGTTLVRGDLRREISRAVALLSGRQREDGGIGYWSSSDWSTAWLSAYAGHVLLDAASVGVPVDTLVLQRLAEYVTRDLQNAGGVFTPVANWYGRRAMRLRDQVAATDFLSRLKRPAIAAENELFRNAAQLTTEDRARLALVLARRGEMTAARALMASTWALIRVEGRAATMVELAKMPFYFESAVRPMAHVLMATLAVDSTHPLIGPMVEAVAQQGRAARGDWMWNTQDYASAVMALSAFDQLRRGQSEREVRVRAGGRVVLAGRTARAGRDSSVALTGLLANAPNAQALRIALEAGPGEAPVYYYLTVSEISKAPPVTPDNNGIQVERWYEHYDRGTPLTSVTEGDLVRVRLRITVPRQRSFVVLDDALPAGLEAVDLSLRTVSLVPGPGANQQRERPDEERSEGESWSYGRWDSGWWSPFDHREIRDDRIVYSATVLWPGAYTATYIARATTPGTFIRPPAHAEEMYNPAVNGRSDGGTFIVLPRGQ